ncbi:MAG TPA: EAL domain-containing protein [Spirochaetia bacterium]
MRDATGDRHSLDDTVPVLESIAQLPDEDPNPVLRLSRDGTLLYANRASWVLLSHWQTQVGSRVPPSWVLTAQRALDQGEVLEEEVRIAFKTILLVVVPIPTRGYINLYGLDVTRRRQVEDKLRLIAQVFENVTEGIMILDGDRRIVEVNRAFCAITGRTREEVLGEQATPLTPGTTERETPDIWGSAARQGSWQGEVWDRRGNGDLYPQWLSVTALTSPAGEPTGFICLFSDITAKKDAERRLYRMAHYDSLTGLGNRRRFHDLLDHALKNARRTGEILALLFIDLDTFKMVNDNLGHGAGDSLLRIVAGRLEGSVRESDTVARMGGDEFTVILPHLQTAENAEQIARKLLAAVTEPAAIEGKEIFITASIGIALYPRDGADTSTLLRSADAAMYHAKQRGRNGVRFFSRDMNRWAARRLALQTRIRRALESREFIAYYQPVVDVVDGRITGLEALVRWRRGDGKVLGPDLFIPVAEQSGQINEIGETVLRLVCAQGVEWNRRGLLPGRLDVNVSSRQLWRSDFTDLVESVLDDTGFPANRLELELTESMLIVDSSETLEKLERLRSLGVSLAIDDFGSKYSSFTYLRRLPVERLKVDRSFIQDMGNGGREITGAIIAVARSLGLAAVAEGVENAEQMAALAGMGCPEAQGYFLSRPVPSDAAESLLENGFIVGRDVAPARTVFMEDDGDRA